MSNIVYSHDKVKSDKQVTIVNPAHLYDPAPNGYSHVVISNNLTKLAFIAGQGGENSNGILPASFEGQVKQAYINLNIALDAIEAGPRDVMKITTYVVDYNQSKLETMTKFIIEIFGDALPAQSLVPVPRLALDGMLFEVDAVVALE